MQTIIAGIRIPDSPLARAATDFVRDAAGDTLFRHSMRVYLWGALHAERRGLAFDTELLHVAAMFHDFGLTAGFRTSQLRFEVDGANAARDFLRSHGIAAQDAQKAWLAIALHTTPGIPEHLEPEIALTHVGAAMDVVGRGYDQVRDDQREAVIEAYPRGDDFERAIIDAFYDGLKHRPQTTYGTFNDDYLAFKDPAFRRVDVCNMILSSRWREHPHPSLKSPR